MLGGRGGVHARRHGRQAGVDWRVGVGGWAGVGVGGRGAEGGSTEGGSEHAWEGWGGRGDVWAGWRAATQPGRRRPLPACLRSFPPPSLPPLTCDGVGVDAVWRCRQHARQGVQRLAPGAHGGVSGQQRVVCHDGGGQPSSHHLLKHTRHLSVRVWVCAGAGGWGGEGGREGAEGAVGRPSTGASGERWRLRRAGQQQSRARVPSAPPRPPVRTAPASCSHSARC